MSYSITRRKSEVKLEPLTFWAYKTENSRELVNISDVQTDLPDAAWEIDGAKLTVFPASGADGCYRIRVEVDVGAAVLYVEVFYAPVEDLPIPSTPETIFNAASQEYPSGSYDLRYSDTDSIKSIMVRTISTMASEASNSLDAIRDKFYNSGNFGFFNQPVPNLRMDQDLKAKPLIKHWCRGMNTFSVAGAVALMIKGYTGNTMKVGVTASTSRHYVDADPVQVLLEPDGSVFTLYDVAKLFNSADCTDPYAAAGAYGTGILDYTYMLDGLAVLNYGLVNLPIFTDSNDPADDSLQFDALDEYTIQDKTYVLDNAAIIASGDFIGYIKSVSMGENLVDLTYRTILIYIDDLNDPIEDKLTLVKSIYAVCRMSTEVAVVFSSQAPFAFDITATYPNSSAELPIIDPCSVIVTADTEYEVTPFTYYEGSCLDI